MKKYQNEILHTNFSQSFQSYILISSFKTMFDLWTNFQINRKSWDMTRAGYSNLL